MPPFTMHDGASDDWVLEAGGKDCFALASGGLVACTTASPEEGLQLRFTVQTVPVPSHTSHEFSRIYLHIHCRRILLPPAVVLGTWIATQRAVRRVRDMPYRSGRHL